MAYLVYTKRFPTLNKWIYTPTLGYNSKYITLVCQIDVQGKINVLVETFLKNIKCAGQNRRAGGNFSSKSINVQTKIRLYRGDTKLINVHARLFGTLE